MVEVVATYDYVAVEEDEVSIKVGDVITDVVKHDGGWWEGVVGGKKGMFPDNFVKEVPKKEKANKDMSAPKRQSSSHVASLTAKLGNAGGIKMGPPNPSKTAPDPNKKKVLAKVVYAYTPENSDEIELTLGSTIEILKQVEEGWWEGKSASGDEGMFPSNFVKIVTEEDEKTPDEESTEFHEIKGKKAKGVGFGNIFGEGPIKLRKTDSHENNKADPPMMKTTKKALPPAVHNDAPALPPKETKEAKQCERARVLYSYNAENEDELGLTEGDIIVILDKELEDSGWWKGELNGKIGVFPDNFVELLPPEEVSKPRKPPPPAVPPNNTKHRVDRPAPPEPTAPIESPKPAKKEIKDEKKAPVAGKKPVPPPLQPKGKSAKQDRNLIAQTDDHKAKEKDNSTDNHLDAVGPNKKLSHPTANRAKAPVRRPPSTRGGPVETQQEEKQTPAVRRPPPPVHKEDSPRSPSKESPRSPPPVNDKDGRHHHHDGASVAEIKALKAEIEHLRSSTVSRDDYDTLKNEVASLREEMSVMRNQFRKRMNELMVEVDEEKKQRLNTQVEIERVKKLVMDS